MNTHPDPPGAATPAATTPAPSTTPAIAITGLTKTFGVGERRVRAVSGIDLSIGRGEVVALLGPNGAGKTTTLDMLLGLSAPNSGTISVLGKPPRAAVAAGQLSALLQTGGLLADLTVAETVRVIAGFHSASSRVNEVMDRTGLKPIARRKVSKCSGGEQQRVKFALALLPDPDVLVLDEPTSGMDVNARRRFWEVMHEEADAGRTVVFATHYLEEAEQFARRTVVMNHGAIVADGATAQLRASLGGRVVTATLPAEVAAAIHTRLNSGDLGSDLIGEIPADDIKFDADVTERGGGRISVRTPHSDALAARLLELGAHDLEIAAPSLESAFTTLTED